MTDKSSENNLGALTPRSHASLFRRYRANYLTEGNPFSWCHRP